MNPAEWITQMEELAQQFTKGHKGYLDIDQSTLSSNNQEYQQLVHESLSLFTNVADLINQHSIFSPNEELDDIATDHLRYLIIII